MLKKKECDILNILRDNGRISLTDIANKKDMPLTSVHDIVRKLKNKGFIKRYTSLLNYSALGNKIRVKMLIRTNNLYKFQDMIRSSTQINNAFQLSGDYDFLLQCVFDDFQEYEAFKNKISNQVIRIDDFFILNELKSEGFRL